MVIEREPAMRAAGQPLVLGGQAPPTQNFGTPLPLAERVRQAIGNPPPAQAAPARPPMQTDPYGLVPPGRIPNANLRPDPRPTGSIGNAARRVEASGSRSSPTANLMSPQPLADQDAVAEPSSVFNLPPAKAD
jgi:hypothetical protein